MMDQKEYDEVKHVLDTNVYGIAQADTILKMKGAIAETANWIKNYILELNITMKY